uniref:Ubiquitin conjugating enzyme E2 L6 n=1 Tax=Myotis myotis TaxID=51298 RepID=A0A7J7VLW1_MYOMY|nr:ubiquitin conjugating enzyme E2 L6 [Myotis myotis]
MTACKRVAKELEDLQKDLPQYLRNLSSDDADVLVWHALLLPEKPPYNLRAFSLRINFPEEYPMRPPTVTFTTKIYHPTVGIDGQVCLPIISVLVNNPDLGEPVRLELADLLTLDSEQFHRRAEEFTLQFGEPRPS